MIKMVIFCVIAYALAWLPFNLVIIIGDFYPDMYEFPYTERIFMFCHFLAMCHTITNPLIYIWMNNRFRAGFKEALLMVLRFIVRAIAYVFCYVCLFGCFLSCSRKKYTSLALRYDRSRVARAFEQAYHTRYLGRSGSFVRQTVIQPTGSTTNTNNTHTLLGQHHHKPQSNNQHPLTHPNSHHTVNGNHQQAPIKLTCNKNSKCIIIQQDGCSTTSTALTGISAKINGRPIRNQSQSIDQKQQTTSCANHNNSNSNNNDINTTRFGSIHSNSVDVTVLNNQNNNCNVNGQNIRIDLGLLKNNNNNQLNNCKHYNSTGGIATTTMNIRPYDKCTKLQATSQFDIANGAGQFAKSSMAATVASLAFGANSSRTNARRSLDDDHDAADDDDGGGGRSRGDDGLVVIVNVENKTKTRQKQQQQQQTRCPNGTIILGK